MRRSILIWLTVSATIAVAGSVTALYRYRDAASAQAERIATAMRWRPGEAVGEVGAGTGSMAMLAAEIVGPKGRVYANEIDRTLLKRIQAESARRRLYNLEFVEGSETATNLPRNCCDAVFMHWVYHHFTRPAEMNDSLFRAVRPDGLLGIADFAPDPVDWVAALVRRHPLHGMHSSVIVREVTSAGFEHIGEVDGWPGKGYFLLFRRPPDTARRTTP